jgi:hypothetical protein
VLVGDEEAFCDGPGAECDATFAPSCDDNRLRTCFLEHEVIIDCNKTGQIYE